MTNVFPEPTTATARLALDTILHTPTKGIPAWIVHIMEQAMLERAAGAAPGEYARDPERVYLDCERNAGTCMIDQFIPTNPLSMGARGYEGGAKAATHGIAEIVLDGMVIDSPEAVCEHMEQFVFPSIRRAIKGFDEDARVAEIVASELDQQRRMGPDFLKCGYGFVSFPGFRYGQYGYVNYFSAYALYPEVMEKAFALGADLAVLNNRAAARAYREAKLPPLYRLDHDMTDSRGSLVDMRSLEAIWFPHVARALQPMLATDVRMIWHCDGNVTDFVPRLLEIGIAGFQGFQYEDGVDYEKICHMTTRDGEPLTIVAGVSVTRELPRGTPDDVRAQMKWLVENGPRTGLMLGCSSSIAPGVPWENLQAMIEGFLYYREHGRS